MTRNWTVILVSGVEAVLIVCCAVQAESGAPELFFAQRGFEPQVSENKAVQLEEHRLGARKSNIINKLAVWLPDMDSNHELDKISKLASY
jgi:hypothetical protein